MERVEFRAKPARVVLLFLCSFGFCVAGLVMIVKPDITDHYPRGLVIGMGVAAVVFFGLCSIVIFKQIFDRSPRIVMSDEGLQVKGMQLIPWKSIQSVAVVRIQRQKFVELRLNDEQERVAALSTGVRSLAKLNGALGFQPFNIPVTAIGVPAETIQGMILERMG